MADAQKTQNTERITGQQFLSLDGLADWRPIFGGGWACAYFRTGSFEAGVALVERIGALATAAAHYPDVDKFAPGWWTLADPEGNEVDLAIWMAD